MKKISYELLDLMDQYGTDRDALAKILEDCAEQRRGLELKRQAKLQAEEAARTLGADKPLEAKAEAQPEVRSDNPDSQKAEEPDDDTSLADLSPELLAAFSPLRENLIDWMDFNQSETVLVYGADYGVYVGLLQSRVGHLTVLDAADENLAVSRRRWEKEPGAERVEYRSGRLEQLLEEGQEYSAVLAILPETMDASAENFRHLTHSAEEEKTYERQLFKSLKKLVKPGGRLISAVQNAGALKLMAGAKPDADRIALSREELFKLLGDPDLGAPGQGEGALKAPQGTLTLYYPLPDCHFPSAIYSDAYLPQKGELPPIYAEYEKPRYRLFSEEAAYDLLCEAGAFPQFANSYLAVWEKG